MAGSCEHCDEGSTQSVPWLAEAILECWEEIMKKTRNILFQKV